MIIILGVRRLNSRYYDLQTGIIVAMVNRESRGGYVIVCGADIRGVTLDTLAMKSRP